ncbi:acetylcholinesterase precursor [Macrophomina phaseolina]|uniref:Carboxylic ester hydrolase n=1 Tax=Macrophomina phaseolina TaxID=35725 RepID=A0ABQ8GAZ2_9PEZI|nr:acetylcholinesterase precursor [Macrophomina phaseolina]
MLEKLILYALLAIIPRIYASPARTNPYDTVYNLREQQTDSLVADLGYAIYKGYTDREKRISSWKGIRYAAAPIGKLRFQAPQVPSVERDRVYLADRGGFQCPQTSWIGTNPGEVGNEDCTFLNVFSPDGARDLPVFVFFHWGGYSRGNASFFQPEALMNANGNGFVSVIVQYRLGAFGWLASEEVAKKGALNVGFLDQRMTLQWVKRYIGIFGGDPAKVTIAGQSSGAGSVMHHAIAYDGQDAEYLWSNGIAASPFLPQVFHYTDKEVRDHYLAFVGRVGCTDEESTFDCLQNARTEDLINANNELAKSALWGTYTWKPVVSDDGLVPDRPSTALEGKLNGKRLIAGNSAEEGWLFTPQNITTRALFVEYLRRYFPRLMDDEVTDILQVYHTPNVPDDPEKARYWTSGTSGVTAVNQSGLATGHQQVANNFYGEVTFFCPSYWLTEAYQRHGEAYQYQYSVIPSYHGTDNPVYDPALADPSDPIHPVLRAEMQRAWGGFIMSNKPADWPRRTVGQPVMINLNTTGGTVVDTKIDEMTVKKLEGPGVTAESTEVNADTWEGGRGARCRFLRSLAESLVI